MNWTRVLPSCLGVALVFASVAVLAATSDRWTQANGSGVCQAALPNYEGQIRKRPLAIQNEGTANAFISCSPVSFQSAPATTRGYQITVANRSDAAVSVTCTAVIGGDMWWAGTYIPQTLIVPADDYSTFIFDGNTPGFHTHAPFNLSCNIPPGVGLGSFYTGQFVQVGE